MVLLSLIRDKLYRILFGKPVPIIIETDESLNPMGKKFVIWILKVDWYKEGWSFQWQRKDHLDNTWYNVDSSNNFYKFRTYDSNKESFKIRCELYNRYCNKTKYTIEVVIKP